MADLTSLFAQMADALDGPLNIEQTASKALLNYDAGSVEFDPAPLPGSIARVLSAPDAHPLCKVIAETPLPWAAPTTSADLAYLAVGKVKAHVELLGPGGLVKANDVRIGLYGMLPHADYGIRTHPAEEVFVMLAGAAAWKRGDADYEIAKVGDRSHHPSLLPHATRTGDKAFMSIYVWTGDVSTEKYKYSGQSGGDV